MKRGQMKLSFGMIFSIILIIVFLAFTIYSITKFLGWQKSIQVGKFYTNLQVDVDKLWKGGQGGFERTYILPNAVEKVCFVSFDEPKKGADLDLHQELSTVFYEFENLILYPIGSGGAMDPIQIKHLNMSKILESDNPLCINNVKGKVKLNIKMNPGDTLVTITK